MKGQNTTKFWKRTVLDTTRRLFSVILTSAMVFTNVGTGLNTVYASDADTVEFTMDSSQLLAAVEDAIADSQEITAADMDFTNGKIDEFEDYFFGSGKLLEAFPETEGGSMDAELRVFIRVPEDADETYMVTGSEDIIFLYVNNGDDTIRCTTSITRTEDGEEKVKKTRSITVKDFETAFGDEDVNYLSKPAKQPETSVPETAAPTEGETVETETETEKESEAASSEESESAAPETEETETDMETAAPEENAETPEETEAKAQDKEAEVSLEDTVPTANISRHEAPVVAWSAFRGGVIDFSSVENFDIAETDESEDIADDRESDEVQAEEESTEAPKSTEALESLEAQESTEALESLEVQESTEALESLEAQESTEALESLETQESTEALESLDVQESTEALESLEAQESTEASKANPPAAEKLPTATSSEINEDKPSSPSNADGLVGIGNCSAAKAYSATLSALKVMEEQTIVSTTADDGALIAVSGTPKAMKNIAEIQAEAITEVDAFVEQLNAELSAAGEMVDKIAVYDVTVIDREGNETQPGDEVKVTITVPELTEDETAEVGAFHARELAENSQSFEVEIKDADVNQAQGTVVMGTDSFSPVGAYTVVSANGSTYHSWEDSKWKTEPIELEPTTEGISLSYEIVDHSYKAFEANIIVTINENVNADELNVNLDDYIMNEIIPNIDDYMWNGVQPGDTYQFNLKIVNNSAHDYQYKNNSFAYTILNTQSGGETAFKSFTGTPITTKGTVWDMGNTALTKQLNHWSVSSVGSKVNRLANGFTFTDKAGVDHTYSGLDELHLFYIDFYNDKYGLEAAQLDQFPDDVIAEILGYNPDPKGEFMGQGQPLGNRASIPELAETGYNFFYNSCLRLFANENDLDTASLKEQYASGAFDADTYSIGSHIRSYNNTGTTTMEPILTSSFSDIKAGQNAALTHNIVMSMDGPFTTNAYQVSNFGFTFGFKLQKPAPVDGTITFNGTKVLTGREFTADDAYTFVLKQDGVEVDRTTVKPAETPAFTLTDNLISGEEGTQVVYTISEEGAGTTIDNVTYDSTIYTAAYDITVDDAANTLTAVYANGDNLNAGVTFTNIYNKPEEPVTPPTPDRPSGGGSGSGSGGGTPSGHHDTPETGGPGVTIDEPQVPLAPAPAEDTITIMDPDVPLAPLPKTGQKNDGLMETLTMIISGFFLAAALLGRKRTKES